MPNSTRSIKPSSSTPVFAAVPTPEEQRPEGPDAAHQPFASIHALAEVPLDGVTLAPLKKMATSMNRLVLSECWMPADPGTMPPYELAVIVWDSSRGKPEAVFLDPDGDCWVSQSDGSKTDAGNVTHWRYCHAPGGIDSEGAAS